MEISRGRGNSSAPRAEREFAETRRLDPPKFEYGRPNPCKWAVANGRPNHNTEAADRSGSEASFVVLNLKQNEYE